MAFRRFVVASEDGSVVKDYMGRQAPAGEGWFEIPVEQHHMLGLGPNRIRWDGEKLVEKPRIRLSVGAFTWPADGLSVNAVCVRGEALGSHTEVRVLVNGTVHMVTKNDDLLLTSESPGDFIIKVADPYFYAVPSEAKITATEVDDAEG